MDEMLVVLTEVGTGGKAEVASSNSVSCLQRSFKNRQTAQSIMPPPLSIRANALKKLFSTSAIRSEASIM